MDARDALRARFERAIDLPAYLGLHGFEPVALQSPADGLAMTNPATGQKLLLHKDLDRGGWTYIEPRQGNERGTIVDYLKQQADLPTDACLERLIACVDERRFDIPEAVQYRAYLHDKPEPLRKAQGEYLLALERRRDATKCLERLGIQCDSLDEWRFGRMNTERDVVGVVGEPQQLWASKFRPTDRRLVVTETPLDAMSLEQTRGDQRSCYIATGSRLDDDRKRRVAHVLAEIPPGTSVVLAFGRDQCGRQLAEQVRALAPSLRMERMAPEFGSRWSNQVQFEQQHAKAMSRATRPLGR